MCFRPPTASATKKCPNCGTENPSLEIICSECGAELPLEGVPSGAPSMPAAPKPPGAPSIPGTPRIPGPPKA